jgi:hypothetical protein
VPVPGQHLLAIAVCVDGASVYVLAGFALTVSCPLAQPRPFRSRSPGQQPSPTCVPEASHRTRRWAEHVGREGGDARRRGSRRGSRAGILGAAERAHSTQSANQSSQRESSHHAFTGRIQKIREPGHARSWRFLHWIRTEPPRTGDGRSRMAFGSAPLHSAQAFRAQLLRRPEYPRIQTAGKCTVHGILVYIQREEVRER